MASRIAYTLLGLTPLILFGSGCLMWWNRSGRRLVRGRRTPPRGSGRRIARRVRPTRRRRPSRAR